MVLSFTDDQQELRTVVRKFLGAASPEVEVRRLMATTDGFDQAVWFQLADELGLCGLSVPALHGGAGCTFVEVGIVLEELGRSLACLPYFSSVVLAQSLLLAAGDADAAARWLPGLAAGTIRGTVACMEEGNSWDEASMTTSAHRHGESWALTGTRNFVIDGHTADVVFTAARTEAGTSLFAVDAAAAGLTRTPLRTIDQTRKQARLEFGAVAAELVGTEGHGWTALCRVLELATVGLSMESVGGAQVALEMAVDYAKNRVQFGRPIGAFQAIKHRCADILVEIECAKAATYHALSVTGTDAEELAFAASLAKASSPDAFFEAAAANIHVHGGIGFTWEHPAHLYYRRAKTNQLLFGDSIQHRQRLASQLAV